MNYSVAVPGFRMFLSCEIGLFITAGSRTELSRTEVTENRSGEAFSIFKQIDCLHFYDGMLCVNL